MDLVTTLLLVVAGLAAGSVGALLGVGGGMVVIPVLTTFYGFNFEQARATSLLAVIATSCGVAVASGKERFANARLGIVLGIPTVLVALLNALFARRVDASLLYALFAAVLGSTALLMWRHEKSEDDDAEEEKREAQGALDGNYLDPKLGEVVSYRVRRIGGVAVVSGFAGALSGLLGVGGGVFQVPAMNLLGGVPMRAAAATSNFLLGMTAAATLPVYFGRGHVRPLESAAVILGVLTGAFGGASLAKRVHGDRLRRIFSLLLIVLALQMLRKAGVIG